MTSLDYTKEVGILSPKKTVPRSVAAGILGVLAVGVSFGVAGVLEHAKEFHRAEKHVRAPVAARSVPAAEGTAGAPATTK